MQVNTNVCKPQMYSSIQKNYRNMYNLLLFKTLLHTQTADFIMQNSPWSQPGGVVCTILQKGVSYLQCDNFSTACIDFRQTVAFIFLVWIFSDKLTLIEGSQPEWCMSRA